MSAQLWNPSLEDALRQHQLVRNAHEVLQLLEQVPLATLLVNGLRQIVYANPAAGTLLPTESVDDVVGKRLGEAVHCRHSDGLPGGCGTTEFCTTCGANKALRAGQRGERSSQECRIVSKTLGGDLDLCVWAAPYSVAGETFTLVSLQDIRNEKRRAALEQVFFHDVLNTADGIHGILSLCEGSTPEERDELAPAVGRLAGQLIDELKAQQSMTAMETGELLVQAEALSTSAVLDGVTETYRNHRVAAGRRVCVDAGRENVRFVSDGTLLRRVLGNLLKNALEACPWGGLVTLTADATRDRVRFRVHNPTAMPRDVQLQVFQQSFSTKGRGRGLGTYSVKLLSERYLKGEVSFTSSEEVGTTFTATYPRRL